MLQRILNHADRGITAQLYNQYSYAKEIEVALEMLAGKIREGIAADPAQGVVVLTNRLSSSRIRNFTLAFAQR